MNNVITELFELDSVEDLYMRGFDRGYILNATHVDIGYHSRRMRGKFRVRSRPQYIKLWLQERGDRALAKQLLKNYAEGTYDRDDMAKFLKIGDPRTSLRDMYTYLDLRYEFEEARKKHLLLLMQQGRNIDAGDIDGETISG